MIGFVFANESEAQNFSQKVISNKDSKCSLFHFPLSLAIAHKTCSKTPLREEKEESG